MGKKKQTDIEGQLCFDMCLNPSKYVVQHNDLVLGRQNLKLNSAKLIRLAIMQIKPEDDELKPYAVSVKEFADLLQVASSNLYSEVKNIIEDIESHPVKIEDPRNGRILSVPWHSAIAYDDGKGIAIELNPRLKGYLLHLRAHYTQYRLEDILTMKSVYAIRVYELLQEEMLFKLLPRTGADIEIPVAVIRKACDCEKTLERFSDFKRKVLDVAIREIMKTTNYHISYDCRKTGREITHIVFHCIAKYYLPDWGLE